MPEILQEFFIRVRDETETPHVKHLCTQDSVGVRVDELNESLEKILRSAASRPYKYPVPPSDVPEYSLLRDELFRLLFFNLIEPVARFLRLHFDLLPEYLNKFSKKCSQNFSVDKK